MSKSYSRGNESTFASTLAPTTAQPALDGYGNSARVEDAGIESSGGWLDWVTAGVDEDGGISQRLLDWFSGEDEDEASPEPEPGFCPVPEEVQDGEGVCEEVVQAPYLDQVDNEPEFVWNDTERGEEKDGVHQCTPTATAMAILGLIGFDAFRERAEVLFEERGQPMDPGWFLTAAPEHVIWTYIYLRDFDQWMALIGGQLDDHVPPHKSSFVMRVVMEEFSEAKCTAILVASNGLQTCQEVIEAIKTLPAVVGTDATSRGHTMTLLGVLSSGVVVNDPNGACRMKSQYLENGSSGLAPPEHRWSMNASLAGADPKTEERTDWGETNFFTWDEVETLQIGKWSVSVASEGASEAQQAIT